MFSLLQRSRGGPDEGANLRHPLGCRSWISGLQRRRKCMHRELIEALYRFSRGIEQFKKAINLGKLQDLCRRSSLTSPLRFIASSRQYRIACTPALSSRRTWEQSSTRRGRSAFSDESTSSNKLRACSTLNFSGSFFTTTGLALFMGLIRGSRFHLSTPTGTKKMVCTQCSIYRQRDCLVYPVLPVERTRDCISTKV